jgi:integrase
MEIFVNPAVQPVAGFSRAEGTAVAQRSSGTFNRLVRDFTSSIEFQSKADSTQSEYKRMLTKAEAEFGDLPMEALNDPGVRRDFMDWREKVARTSGNREADNRLSAISSMITWAVDRGQPSANHLKGFKRLYHGDRSEIIWLPEHITAFMKMASVEMQRALILALHTGQRQGDLLRLPWSAYDGQRIKLRQGKARRSGKPGQLVDIPCTKALRRMLDNMERISPLILTTKTGQAFKKRYFASQWDAAMKAAGLQHIELPGIDEPVDLHFHDLRGTAVTLLSEAGCSHQQVASITGHTLKTVHHILERYLARTKGLGDQAIENWESSPRTKFANRLIANRKHDGGTKKEHQIANQLQTGTKADVSKTKKKKPPQ